MQIFQLTFQFVKQHFEIIRKEYSTKECHGAPKQNINPANAVVSTPKPNQNQPATIRKNKKSNRTLLSDPQLKLIWDSLAHSYFPELSYLNNYQIQWSGRIQTRCLASCNIEKQIVRVAGAMKLEESKPFLDALIYHELCHAVAGIRVERGRRRIHTREFKALEKLHPGITALDQWIHDGGWVKAVKHHKALERKRIRNS
ncbi:MAG TPA: SprT-like domain-containing protein [Oligoflexia bacterium]|nr:SprT-like domain-containing protein [Oligoflexia bacterium]HMP48230.1 SprT-like domain-containing protein [Oligoflexia bacterium]